MKALKLSLVITAAALLTISLGGMAYAFHDGGVAYCDGCHTMHNSSGGVAMAKSGSLVPFQGNKFLLQGLDDSSTCLNCHAATAAKAGSYHVMTFPAPAVGTAPSNFTPGGDFAWLTQTYSAVGGRGQTITNKGERHGHNVVAAGFGLVLDSTLTTAPGGTFPAASLSCPSCHDPHSRARIVDATGTIAYTQLGAATLPINGPGSYGAAPTASEAVGVYRLLGGKNYVLQSASYTFTYADPPVAVAPNPYNQPEAVNEVRVAYGQGMSEWCANCHLNIHNDNVGAANTALIHPTGNGAKLNQPTTVNGVATTEAGIYNAYKKSGDLTGAQATSYTSLVPYEEGIGTVATLASHATNTAPMYTTAGPSTGSENVMCLTCHRAHATAFPSMTRWNNSSGGEFITVNSQWPDSANAASVDYAAALPQLVYQAAMYNRAATPNFATYQRSLCNKCHAKD